MLSQTEIHHRNRLLRKFFTDRECPIEIMDININAPAIVWNGTHVLSAYVKNFKLYFTNAPRGGEVLQMFNLSGDNSDITKRDIEELILKAEHRRVYRLRYAGTDLYLVGYNYQDRELKKDRYPVFAKCCAKYYFGKDSAQEILDSHPDYDLEIV